MENYTYKSLGFENIEAILKPRAEKSSIYNTVGIKEPLENVKNYLIHCIYEYVMSKKNGKLDGFVAAVAYMMNGIAIMVYSGSGENRTKLMSVLLDQDVCKNHETLTDYIAGYIIRKKPEGLALIQEIPAVQKGEYHFRIIHDKTEDRNYNNVIRFPGPKSKGGL